jgi:hypothetical protein
MVAVGLLLQTLGSAAAANCSALCGGINISYPFGIEPGCYRDGFNLTCDHSYRPPNLFLGDGTVEVLEISIPSGTVRVSSSSARECQQHRQVSHMGWAQEGRPLRLAGEE